MDIGTAKPSDEDFASVPHHLFNIIDPDQEFSLPEYQKATSSIIDNLHNRKVLPFLVGGSGQYIRGLLEGWQVPKVKANAILRKALEDKAAEKGIDAIFSELMHLDPEAAAKIDKRNIRRVIRALEVCLSSGEKFSEQKTRQSPDYKVLYIGLTTERKALYQKVDARVDAMITIGLIEEVRGLLARGYNLRLPSMSSIGYQQIGKYLNNELTLEKAVEQIKSETHRYIRHQYAWFHLNDPQIKWFDIAADPYFEVVRAIDEFLN
jgi:tRNA dimethylallyltransferase